MIQLTQTSTLVDQDTEIALLASAIDPGAAIKATAVRAADFSDRALGKLFDLIQWMHQAGESPEGQRLIVRMREAKILDQIGIEMVGKIFDRTFAERASVAFHAKRVIALATARKLMAEFASVQSRLQGQLEDPEEIARETQTIIDAVLARSTIAIRSAGDVANEIVEEIGKPNPQPSVLTGLDRFDYNFGGFCPGDLVVLAARTSVGKTALALQVAEFNARMGKPVLFVSLEMRDSELVGRILAREACVTLRDIRDRTLGAGDIVNITNAASEIQSAALHVYAPTVAKLRDVRAAAKLTQIRSGLSLLVIDYLQIMRADDSRQEKRLQIGELTSGLKSLAKELRVPIMVLAQLTREADKGEPTLAMLKESSSIEEDADQVLLLHRETRESEQARLFMAKNRHGQIAAIELDYVGSEFRFKTRSIEWQP